VLQDSHTQRNTKNLGVFAESTFDLTDATRLNVGLRYDNTKVNTATSSCSGVPLFGPLDCFALTAEQGTRNWNNWTYKLRLEQDLTSTSLLYASVATAFLPGDVQVANALPDAHLEAAPYEPETLTSFEVGSKNRFLDDRLQANAAIFYYKYGAFQQPVKVGQYSAIIGIYNVSNSPATVLGAELELLLQATPNDRFGLNASYVDAQYKDKSAVFQLGVVQDRVPGIVPLSISPSYTHTFDFAGGQTLSLGLEALYRSALDVTTVSQEDANSGLLPYARTKQQLTGNVNATWKPAEKISFSAYVRNVSDERYKTFLNVSATPAAVGASSLSEPRTYGAVLNVGF
jgi:iron complex outermembrane receptor protein